MSDLISRQVAIEALDNLDYMPGEWAIRGLTMCKEAIRDLPSVQPEIIRCKDCKYYRQNDYGDSWCARQKGFDQMTTDFCSRAERKEE